jgi:hypothetical protein
MHEKPEPLRVPPTGAPANLKEDGTQVGVSAYYDSTIRTGPRPGPACNLNLKAGDHTHGRTRRPGRPRPSGVADVPVVEPRDVHWQVAVATIPPCQWTQLSFIDLVTLERLSTRLLLVDINLNLMNRNHHLSHSTTTVTVT